MSLKAENITKRFGEVTVLDGFSHEFADGAVTVIMGASGCGKSTLLAVLMGIIKPDSGTVTGNDTRLSAVFQEDRLCENLTVMSNIRLVLGKKAGREMLISELAKVGLEDCADKPARELSGGMKRRTARLRALLAEYDILFLDEPFKGLDEDTKRTVMEYTKRMTAGKTVILVTHDRDEAEFFGGKLTNLSDVFHGVQTPIDVIADDYIFNGLDKKLDVGRYHSWVVSREGFPESLVVTAVSAEGQVMALRHKEYDIHGIQFHPESVLTPCGSKIVENFLKGL